MNSSEILKLNLFGVPIEHMDTKVKNFNFNLCELRHH